MATTPVYITNAFSLSMIPSDKEAEIKVFPIQAEHASAGLRAVLRQPHFEVYPISVDAVRSWNGRVESIVGHADTAAIFSSILGMDIQANRVSVTFDQPHTRVLVGQYVGPRLPEGTTTLPEGARIDWKLVTVDIT